MLRLLGIRLIICSQHPAIARGESNAHADGLAGLLLAISGVMGEVGLDIEVGGDFSYEVALNNVRWLRSSPVRAFFSGTENPTPSKDGSVVASNSTDAIGSFSSKLQKWKAGTVGFSTEIKVYGAGLAVFETSVPGGAARTNASIPIVPGGWPGSQGNVKPIVAFPAFSTAAADVGDGSTPGLAALDQLRWEDNFCFFRHGSALSIQGDR